jgi:hypothetical protein
MTDFQKYQEEMQIYQSRKLHQVIQQRDKLRVKYEEADSWRFIWKVIALLSIGYIVGSSIVLGGWL